MREIQYLWFTGCLWLMNPSSVLAETLSLPEVLALVERHNPELAATRQQISGASADLTAARAYPNPELDASGGHARATLPGAYSGLEGRVGIVQPLDLPYVREPRRRGGEAGIAAAEAAYQNARLTILTRAKLAYYDVLRQQQLLQIAEENRQLLEQIRDRIKVKVEVGEAARFELVKANAEVLNASKNRESAALRIRLARTALRALLGVPLAETAQLTGQLPEYRQLRYDMENLWKQIEAGHPLLIQARAEVKRNRAQLDLERALRYPQLRLTATAIRDIDTDRWQLGLNIPLPLWNQRQGQIGRAAAELQRAQSLADQQALLLLRDLESAVTNFRIATQQLETFEGGLLKQAEQALQIAESAYRLGGSSILDYLDAQRTYRSVRTDYVNARFDQYAAVLEIERLQARTEEKTP